MSYVDKLVKELQRRQDEEGLLQMRLSVNNESLSVEELAKGILQMLECTPVEDNNIF